MLARPLRSADRPSRRLTTRSPAFDALASTLRGEGLVDEPYLSPRRAFGADALKVNGKIFAMSVKGALVLKLPKARCDALIGSGSATPFDPGHGRQMKQWVALKGAEETWLDLAREAHAFVKTGGR